MESKFQDIHPDFVPFDKLLYGRLFRIPEYQRAYSWQSKQRKDLFNDITRIGRDSQGRSHFMATVVGLQREKSNIMAEEHEVVEVVDGQQRLTTLIILLKAISNGLSKSNSKEEAKVRNNIEHLLVKNDEATLLLLQTNHDLSNYFANYIRDGQYPDPESAKTLADRELLSCIEECENFVQNWQKNGKSLIELVSTLKNRLTFVFHRIGDEGLVYSVFEVLNSRGLPVSWVDRFKSSLMAMVFEAKINNKSEIISEIHKLWSDIYRTIGLHIGLSTESLRFAATLNNSQCPSRPLSEEDAVVQLVESCHKKPGRAIEITRWVETVTSAVNKLLSDNRRSAVTEISQARLFATAVFLRNDMLESEKHEILNQWEKVTFRIYGMYRKDARTAVGDYVRLAWRVVQEKLPKNDIIKELKRIGAEFTAKGAIDSLRKTDCYMGWQRELIYFFNRYEEHLSKKEGQKFDNEQWNRIWEGRPSDSIEHIFPQSRTKGDWVHWLGNLLIITPKLNSALGKKSPEKKIASYRNSGLLIAQDTARRIEKKKWDKTAILNRENSILMWAKKEWAD